ncbi:MAG: tRNA-dihydrouridine synthase [Patescibacteria group bacterium]
MNNFWNDLKTTKSNPISVLAPMYDVTDVAFRQLIATLPKTQQPDVLFTEFANADSYANPVGKINTLKYLLKTNEQKPVVAQIWGVTPANYHNLAKDIVQMGFDGIDINMGCPQKNEMKIGACAALINNQNLASQIIQATLDGAANKIPVSVKTRTGVKKVDTANWISFLDQFNISTVTLHGRTAAQLSKVPADWEQVKLARTLLNSSKVLIGNGDVENAEHGTILCSATGANGYMIGRGIFKNPFAFQSPTTLPTKLELVQLGIKHVQLFKQFYANGNNGGKNYQIMKKFFKVYANTFEGASELRSKLMETNTEDEALNILNTELLK